jgi:hypothetical protein
MTSEKLLLPDVNALIEDKLASYPDNVRELALKAIQLAESQQPEAAIADQLQTVVRRLAKPPEGDTL